MREALDRFEANLAYVQDLEHLHEALRSNTTQALDLSDILRGELVLIVSALDHYVHQIVILGMMETISGKRKPTKAFLSFSVSLKCLTEYKASGNQEVIKDEIKTKTSYHAYQKPEKIAEALALVTEEHLWSRVAERMGTNPNETRRRLDLIVERRNKIAHESDTSAGTPRSKTGITRGEVHDAVDFIGRLVEAIHNVIVP